MYKLFFLGEVSWKLRNLINAISRRGSLQWKKEECHLSSFFFFFRSVVSWLLVFLWVQIFFLLLAIHLCCDMYEYKHPKRSLCMSVMRFKKKQKQTKQIMCNADITRLHGEQILDKKTKKTNAKRTKSTSLEATTDAILQVLQLS